MTRFALLLVAFHPLFGSAENKPNFAGDWVLNVGKSNFGKISKPTGMTLQATRNGDVLHSVQTTIDQNNGTTTSQGDWDLDGKERPLPSTNMTQMSKWDGQAIVAQKKSSDGAYQEDVRMTLSADGKTATERISVKSPNGTNTSVLVWERK